jgi:type IX secretion system PorP/SprF family membrane protein
MKTADNTTKNKAMNVKMKMFTLLGAATLLISGIVKAQDPHLSQYDALPMMVNPANTAQGDVSELRVGLQYRSQWASVGSNFLTTAATFEMPLQERFGIGAALVGYNAADIFSTLNFLVSGSYQISDPSQSKFRLSTGVQIGFLYNRINMNQLLFENQFDGENFNPDLPSGEFLDRRSTFQPDANVGFAYENTNARKKINLHGGFAVYHLSRPKENLTSENSRKPIRYAVHGGVKIKINPDFTLDPRFLLMKQGPAQEIMVGAMANFELRQPYGINFGAFYRNSDAIIIQAGLQHNRNFYRISYDINTSKLAQATNNKGAIEVSVLYAPGKKRRNRF